MAIAGFPASIDVTLGSLWAGRNSLDPSDVVTLQKVIGQDKWSEDGTLTFNTVTNRLMLQFSHNANSDFVSINVGGFLNTYFYPEVVINLTSIAAGAIYNFKDIFDTTIGRVTVHNATPSFLNNFTGYSSGYDVDIFASMEDASGPPDTGIEWIQETQVPQLPTWPAALYNPAPTLQIKTPYRGALRGRHFVFPFTASLRGAHRVINVYDQSLRGRSKMGFDLFDQSLRGRSRVVNAFDQSLRGVHGVKLGAVASLRGRHKAQGVGLLLFSQSLRGIYGVQQEYNQSLKAMNRIANDAIDLFELWIRADAEPDLTTDPTETFVSLPHTTAALTPPASGTRKYFLVLRKRNQYNLSSENFSFWAVTIDAAGTEVVVAPSAPAEYAVAPAAAINANVTAEYFYLPDGDNQADTWAIFLTSNGVNPDLAGAPFTTVPMQKVDGLARLDVDLGPFIEGDTVKVIVTTRRGAVQSVNNEIVETIVTAFGPAKVDADIHLGDQAGISSTEGDNHG